MGRVAAAMIRAMSLIGVHEAAAALAVIPRPASLELRGPGFALDARTRIVVPARGSDGDAATRIAERLAGTLRRSTGLPFPVGPPSHGTPGGTRLLLELDGDDHGHGGEDEGYRLDTGRDGARLQAASPAGLFRGVQTLLQLLPPAIESASVAPGPWPVPGVTIADRPRFPYRGAMLDVARHFLTVAEVQRYIDLISRYKINTLHLHLSDDQGWRIMIDAWPRLATAGGSTEVGGTPGGFYTQDDYRAIVGHAADRYISIVAEIDTPGHTNAALASYAELNCDGVAPPPYTGTDVGFSSLCVDKDITYRFLDDVVGELAALSPGRLFHLGGDEARSTPHDQYARFVERAAAIVARHGKRVMGWEEIARADVPAGSVAEYWNPAAGSEIGSEIARTAVAKGLKLVMAPASRAYLDMKYNAGTPFGLDWAGPVEVQDAYAWDPATFVDGVGEQDVLGVEAAIWTETMTDLNTVEFMAFPRLPGIAEIGWSPREGRSWNEYRVRLAAQAPRWDALGVNYYRSPQVPWRP